MSVTFWSRSLTRNVIKKTCSTLSTLPNVGSDGEVRGLSRAEIASRQTTAKVLKMCCQSRGRPPTAVPKKQLTLRLSPRVVDYFRAQGRGWQTRIDETLRPYVKLKMA
jgi:uncharacterized protein (DUF4415 family)